MKYKEGVNLLDVFNSLSPYEQCEWIVKLIDDGSNEECKELYKLIEDDSDYGQSKKFIINYGGYYQ